MKKFVLPVGAGVVVFGVVTAFAASLGVSSNTLGAGNDTVDSCTANAKVSYATSGSTVTTATVTTYDNATPTPVATTTCAGMSAQVTLTGSGTGLPASLSTTNFTAGSMAFNFTSSGIDAHDVTGVSVVFSG